MNTYPFRTGCLLTLQIRLHWTPVSILKSLFVHLAHSWCHRLRQNCFVRLGLPAFYEVWAAYSCKVVSLPTSSTNSHDCCHVYQLPRFPHWCFCLLRCSLCLSFSMAFTWTSSVVGLAVLHVPAVNDFICLFALRMCNALCSVKSGSLGNLLCVWLSMMPHMMRSLMWMSVCWTHTISPLFWGR